MFGSWISLIPSLCRFYPALPTQKPEEPFSVSAAGGYLTYQWQKDGLPISGATASILTLGNVQSSAQGSYAVTVTSGAGSTLSQPATLTVPTSFSAWQAANFTTVERSNPAISGPKVVLGSGSASNLLKYALGVAPRAVLPAGTQTVGQAGGGWTFTFQHPADRLDLTYTVEISTDLQSWTSAGVTQQLTTSTAGVETWTATYTAISPQLFFRLRITLP